MVKHQEVNLFSLFLICSFVFNQSGVWFASSGSWQDWQIHSLVVFWDGGSTTIRMIPRPPGSALVANLFDLYVRTPPGFPPNKCIDSLRSQRRFGGVDLEGECLDQLKGDLEETHQQLRQQRMLHHLRNDGGRDDGQSICQKCCHGMCS